MTALYRYDWAPKTDDAPALGFDPVTFALFATGDRSIDASVYRGEFRANDNYSLPYRLWLPRAPRCVLLFMHGACDYSGAFDAIAPTFARQGFAVAAYDQRGFGQTRTRGKWAGSRRLARDMGAAVSYFKRRVPDVPIIVVGESMGAALSVRASAEGQIDGIAGMVLVAPGALGCMVRRTAYTLAARVMQALGARADFFVERVNCDDLASDAAIRLLADPLVVRRITPTLLGGLVKLGTRAFDVAPDVNVPTLTLVGTREDVSPLSSIRGLHKRLKGDAAFREFDGGPHLLLHWRERDRVLETIGEWIESRLAPPEPAQIIPLQAAAAAR